MKKLLFFVLTLFSINAWAQCSATVTPNNHIINCNVYPTYGFTAVATTTAGGVRHDWYSPLNPSVPFYTSTNFTCYQTCPFATGVYSVVTTYTSIPCSITSTFQVSSISGFPTFNVSSSSNYSVGCLPVNQSSLCIINATSANLSAVAFLFIPPASTLSLPASTFNFGPVSCKSPSISGTWTLVVMDWSNGCQAALPVIIKPYSNPNINVAVSFPTQTLTCNNQSIIATGTSGTSGAQITWQIPSTSSVINSPTVNVGTFTGPGFSNSSTNYANYTVVATNTVNGCQSQSVVPFYQNFSSAGNSSFSYAVGANGVVNFSNTTSGNNPSCIWDFGDGYITVGNSVSHTYSLGGLYPVKLDIYDSGVSCFKTSSSNVNVTSAPCIANTNFTLTSAGIPHQWNLTPAYPWNISNAVWNWGDGSTSNTLYSSHTYSAIGSYSICLTATVSCGTSSSTCNNYFLYKGNSSAPMIQVNVVPPNSIATSIFEDERNSVIYSVYPNPSNNVLNIRAQYLNSETTSIRIYNILGEQVYMNVPEVINGELNKTIQVDNFVNGIYFIEVTSGNGASTKKIVINR